MSHSDAAEGALVWFDVGAHRGEASLYAAQQNPDLTVYAFEPNLSAIAPLFARLHNYIVIPAAVCETDGTALFYVNTADDTSSLLPVTEEGMARWVDPSGLPTRRAATVLTMRLDTFMAQAGITHVDYMKVDAQGGDLAVLRSAGARLCDLDRVMVGVQTTPFALYAGAGTKDEVLAHMAAFNFALVETHAQSHGQEENLVFVRP